MSQERQKNYTFLNIIIIIYGVLAVLYTLGAARGLLMNGLIACVESTGHSRLFCKLEALLPANVPLIVSLFFIKNLWKPVKFLVLSWLSFLFLGFINTALSVIVLFSFLCLLEHFLYNFLQK